MPFMSLLFILLLLSGCGGFRGGIESVPSISETTIQGELSRPSWGHDIELSDFSLTLSLNNAVQTYQYEVMLFFIPTYFNFAENFRNRQADSLELTLQLTPGDSSITFDPRHLRLIVEGHEVRPSQVWVNNREKERQAFEAYAKARGQTPSNQALPFPQASAWRETIADAITVRPGDKSPLLYMAFPLPLLSPETGLVLDLSQSIIGPARNPVALIRFKPVCWSEGYS